MITSSWSNGIRLSVQSLLRGYSKEDLEKHHIVMLSLCSVGKGYEEETGTLAAPFAPGNAEGQPEYNVWLDVLA